MSGVYLYLIVAGDGKSPVKIGVASDPNARLRQLQTGNAKKLRLAASFEAKDRWIALEWESLAHKLFDADRQHGEWFSSTVSTIVEHVEHWMKDPIRQGRKPVRPGQAPATESDTFEPNHPFVPERLTRIPMRNMTEEERLEFWACFDLPAPPFGFDDWYHVGSKENGLLASFPVVGFVHGEPAQ